MNHGVKVVKLISWPSLNRENGETGCITPPSSQNCRDAKHDERKTVSSIVDKGLSFSSERLGNQCKLIHQEQDVGEGGKVSTPVTTPRCWTSGCGVKCNGPVTRKTCCLIDGGPPCTQFEACPIVETSLCGSSPDSSGKQNQPAPSEQSCNELDAHESSLPEADSNTSNCGTQAESRSTFKCQFCTSEFKQKIHLQKHMMSVHLEQKPYKCDTYVLAAWLLRSSSFDVWAYSPTGRLHCDAPGPQLHTGVVYAPTLVDLYIQKMGLVYIHLEGTGTEDPGLLVVRKNHTRNCDIYIDVYQKQQWYKTQPWGTPMEIGPGEKKVKSLSVQNDLSDGNAFIQCKILP
ncbi:hypothetical protein T265_09317 [Opisthorchis viverrini]|uniref:C2H2-type domain-containing protein n=1 Tax=Opisthorchis viverrini TaxID=6198 RepID=A0A074ZAV5_OPIVI|nr:hypothetical protein T265_09317 [Opisthorchis viverrini]KER22657.1 hypothetical protein T265_09317 [Opisthorchis viverrini]